MLQQYLPFTVLKHHAVNVDIVPRRRVATVLTVYGIETNTTFDGSIFLGRVATVLTVYGIETSHQIERPTYVIRACCNSTYRLRY